MSATIAKISPAVAAFNAELAAAAPESYLRVPGIGLYKAVQIRKALATGAIVLHWSGNGYGWATEGSTDSRGKPCLVLRETVRRFEAEVNAEDARSPRADAATTKKLLASFNRIGFGLAKPAEPTTDVPEDAWAI